MKLSATVSSVNWEIDGHAASWIQGTDILAYIGLQCIAYP